MRAFERLTRELQTLMLWNIASLSTLDKDGEDAKRLASDMESLQAFVPGLEFQFKDEEFSNQFKSYATKGLPERMRIDRCIVIELNTITDLADDDISDVQDLVYSIANVDTSEVPVTPYTTAEVTCIQSLLELTEKLLEVPPKSETTYSIHRVLNTLRFYYRDALGLIDD